MPTERPHHQERGRPDSMAGREQNFYPGEERSQLSRVGLAAAHCPYAARGPRSYLMATTPGPGPLPLTHVSNDLNQSRVIEINLKSLSSLMSYWPSLHLASSTSK